MKKTIYQGMLLVLLVIVCSAFAEAGFNNYRNEGFNYAILIPSSWKKIEINLSEKHILSVTTGSTAEIKVKAVKTPGADIEKIIHMNKWDLRKIDPALNEIISSENITIKNSVAGKLFVFEFRSNRKNLLQRTMITRSGGVVYIVECRASLRTFYRYEEIFNTALSSFKYITRENKEDTPE